LTLEKPGAARAASNPPLLPAAAEGHAENANPEAAKNKIKSTLSPGACSEIFSLGRGINGKKSRPGGIAAIIINLVAAIIPPVAGEIIRPL
jgi:hypothetical protein